MHPSSSRIQRAWEGRISGCMLGKPVEGLSMRKGPEVLLEQLKLADALPLRNYVPDAGTDPMISSQSACCLGHITRSEPDDDINYAVLALMMLEQHGKALTTTQVAQYWLKHLPLASTYTAERAAYRTLLVHGEEWFPERGEAGFDIAECANNPYNDWIGAQIRADVYGWVCPGNPELAVQLVTEDAKLSHQGAGIAGAQVVAAWGSLIPSHTHVAEALTAAKPFLDDCPVAMEAIELGESLAGDTEGGEAIVKHYGDMSAVHTLNNLALVVWAMLTYPDDFDAAIGEVVTAGLDTDCNGATVGGLWGLQDKPIPSHWTDPWQGQVGVSLAGQANLELGDLVDRTLAVLDTLSST